MIGDYWPMGVAVVPSLVLLQMMIYFLYFRAYKEPIKSGIVARKEAGVIVPVTLPALFFILLLGIALFGGQRFLEAFAIPLALIPLVAGIAIVLSRRKYDRLIEGSDR